jgi:hypothetical protein
MYPYTIHPHSLGQYIESVFKISWLPTLDYHKSIAIYENISSYHTFVGRCLPISGILFEVQTGCLCSYFHYDFLICKRRSFDFWYIIATIYLFFVESLMSYMAQDIDLYYFATTDQGNNIKIFRFNRS